MKRDINRLLAGILSAAMIMGSNPAVVMGNIIADDIEGAAENALILENEDVLDNVSEDALLENPEELIVDNAAPNENIEDVLVINSCDEFADYPEAVSANDVEINSDNFPDEVFRNYIKTLDTDSDEVLEVSEINAAKTIDLSNTAVVSINGIKYLTSVNSIDFSNTSINSIPSTELTAMSDLKTVKLDNMRSIKTLNLAGFAELESITAVKTSLVEVTITNCPKLKTADMGINPSLYSASFTTVGGEVSNEDMLNFDLSYCNAIRQLYISSPVRTGHIKLNMQGNMQEFKSRGMSTLQFITSGKAINDNNNQVDITCSKESYLATDYKTGTLKPDYVNVSETAPGKAETIEGLSAEYTISTGLSESVNFIAKDADSYEIKYLDYTVSIEDESVAVIEDIDKYSENGSFKIVTKKGGHTRLLVVPSYNKTKKVIIPLWVVDKTTAVNLECDREVVQRGSDSRFTYRITPDAARHELDFVVYNTADLNGVDADGATPITGITVVNDNGNDAAYVHVDSNVAAGTRFTVVGRSKQNTDDAGKPIYDVLNFSVSKYALTRPSVSMRVGESTVLSANDITTNSSVKASYSSADTSVVTVDSAGKLYAVDEGTTVVKATMPDKTVLYCDVNVINSPVTGIKLNKSNLRIRTGDTTNPSTNAKDRTAELELIFTPSSAAYEYFHEKDGSIPAVDKITITSNKPEVLTVNSDKKLKKAGVVDFSVTAVDRIAQNEAVTVMASVTPEGSSTPLTASCNVIVSPTDNAKVPAGISLFAVVNNDKTLADISGTLSASLINKGYAQDYYVFADTKTALAAYEDLDSVDYKVVHIDKYTGEPMYDYVPVNTTKIVGITPLKVKRGTEYIADSGVALKGDALSLEGSMKLTGCDYDSPEPVTVASLESKGYSIKYYVDKASLAEISGTTLTAKAAGTVTIKAVAEYKGHAMADVKPVTRKITIKDAGSRGTANIQTEIIRRNSSGDETVITPTSGNYILETKEGYTYYIKDRTSKASDGSSFRISYKTSDEMVIKLGGQEKKTGYTVLKPVKSGMVNITCIADDALRTEVHLSIKLVDTSIASVALSEETITYNSAMTAEYNKKEVTVFNGYAADISDVKLVKAKDGKDEALPGFVVAKKSGNSFSINLTNASKSAKGYVKVKLIKDSIANTYYLPVKLNIKSSVPKLKVKQIKKVNTFYKSDDDNDYSGLISIAADGVTILSANLTDSGRNGKPAVLYPLGYQGSIDNVNDARCILSVAPKSMGVLKYNKASVAVYLEGYRKPVEAAVNVAYEETKLKLTGNEGIILTNNNEVMDGNRIRIGLINKSTGKQQSLTDEDGRSLLAIFIANSQTSSVRSGAELSLSGSAKSKYTISVDPYDYNYLIITPKKGQTINSAGDNLTINVKCTNWNKTQTFKNYKIKAKEASKAKLKLEKSSITMYEYTSSYMNEGMLYSAGQVTLDGKNSDSKLLNSIRISGANSKSTAQLNTTLKINYDKESGSIVATYNGTSMPAAGSYKYNVVIPSTASGLSKDIKTTLTINVKKLRTTDESRLVKVKVSGKIDLLNIRDSYSTLNASFTKLPASGRVVSAALTGESKELFELRNEDGTYRVYLKSGIRGFKNKKYNISVKYVLDVAGKEIIVESAPVTIRFTQSKPIMKLSASGAVVSKDAGQDIYVTVNAYNSDMDKLAIDRIVPANTIDGIAYQGVDSDGQIKLEYNPASGIKRGKTYTLKLKVYLSNRAGDSRAEAIKYKVTVRK